MFYMNMSFSLAYDALFFEFYFSLIIMLDAWKSLLGECNFYFPVDEFNILLC
jgi:hypothetical protein